jgi:hypothetical protein
MPAGEAALATFTLLTLREGLVDGATLSTDAPVQSLVATGWIEDKTFGYSDMMTFTDAANVRSNELLGTQVFIGRQNDGIDVDGHLVLRNTTPTSVELKGQFVPGATEDPPSPIALNLGVLTPGEIRDIDLSDLLQTGRISPSVTQGSASLTYPGSEGAVIGRYIGISANKAYGYYAALESFAGHAVSELYWTVTEDW